MNKNYRLETWDETEDIELLNEIRKGWNSLKAEFGDRWCMPDPFDENRKLLTVKELMERMETRIIKVLTDKFAQKTEINEAKITNSLKE